MSREPVHYRGTRACRFSELAVGDTLTDSITITETHVVLAAAIFNDPGPNHLNALQAAQNRFGQRIAHGPLLVGFMCGVAGNVLGSTIVALLEQRASFRHPVVLGDTITGTLTVAACVPKPEAFSGGGTVELSGQILNQNDALIAEVAILLAVADRPLWQPPDQG